MRFKNEYYYAIKRKRKKKGLITKKSTEWQINSRYTI